MARFDESPYEPDYNTNDNDNECDNQYNPVHSSLYSSPFFQTPKKLNIHPLIIYAMVAIGRNILPDLVIFAIIAMGALCVMHLMIWPDPSARLCTEIDIKMVLTRSYTVAEAEYYRIILEFSAINVTHPYYYMTANACNIDRQEGYPIWRSYTVRYDIITGQHMLADIPHSNLSSPELFMIFVKTILILKGIIYIVTLINRTCR